MVAEKDMLQCHTNKKLQYIGYRSHSMHMQGCYSCICTPLVEMVAEKAMLPCSIVRGGADGRGKIIAVKIS